jgi:arsenite-transporting ATPase
MYFLRNSVRFVMVTIPEALAVEQLESIFAEFAKFGFKVKQLIINNVIMDSSSEFLLTKAQQQRQYIELLHDRYHYMEIFELPMFPHEIKGVERLKDIEKSLFE